MLTTTGCNDNTDKAVENTSATVSVSDVKETSAAETTTQTEQKTESTTKAAETEAVPSETESAILKLDKKELYNYEWSEEYAIPLVETEYSAIILREEEAERFPELAAVLTEIADAQEGYMKDDYDMLTELAKEKISYGTEGFTPLKSTYDRQVRRADSKVLSILVDSYYYNGVFDSRSLWGENYDVETGKELKFPDVVTDIDGFAQVAENQLFNYAGEDVFSNDSIIDEYFEMYGADGTHWTIDYNGVTVYFSAGEIAGTGFGEMTVTVTFAEHPELFNSKYTEVPESYISAMPLKLTYYTDLDGDGSCEELTVVDSYDEENDYYATLYISTAEVYYAESFWAYSCEPYYIKAADGKNYIYLFTELETQMYLHVYEVTNNTISKVGEVNVSPFYNNGISAVLTDPNSMHFDIFSDEAGGGISEGNDFFAISTDGMPAVG